MMTSSAQNLGKELQSKREQLGYSLKDVAEHTRIRKVYLESMEQGRLEDLPGQAYVTGFVRVYARHLGLDSDDFLARLNAPQEGDQAPLPESDPDDTASDKPEAQPRSNRGWGAFVLGFVVVLALGALFYFIPISFDSGAPLKSSANDPVKSRETALPQQTEVVPVPGAVTGDAPQPVSLPTVPPEGAILRMLALTESSLIIYLDGHEPREYTINAGLEQSWEVKTSVRVKLAQPGGAQFWLGRQELKLAALDDFYLSTDPGE
jgi:transcriptional regulator with XRE-family HTH domain